MVRIIIIVMPFGWGTSMHGEVRASSFNEGVAFVAGGSGGIGAAITKSLAAAGSDVRFTYYRNEDAARSVVEAARREGTSVDCAQLALEDSAAVVRAIEDARSRFGRIHSVIYAAGPSVPINYVGQIREEDWIKTFALDTHACFNLVQAALPILKEQRGGSFTAVTTTQFARHVPMSVLSSAPKAAIESMMQVLAKEYGRFGVRANCVRSGWLAGGKLADGIGGQVQEKALQAIVAQIPMAALGDPTDVAAAVTFLSSKQARYITGDSLTVDGGWRL
jgi:NAD(P)-dependent dehydrogenase (short-subunit alcohol dehydrogenase family)